VTSSFIKKWRHRLDFLRRETAAQASGLASLLDALAARPDRASPAVVLVATPATARFLLRFAGLADFGPLDVRVVADLTALEHQLAELGKTNRVVIAGELYARFHAALAPHVAAGRVIPA
jgi:hypothetical protein